MPRLEYPQGTPLRLCPTDLAMDMAINTKGANCEDLAVTFLEPVDDHRSKIINEKGRVEVVDNGRLGTWK